MTAEKSYNPVSGWFGLVVVVGLAAVAAWMFTSVATGRTHGSWNVLYGIGSLIAAIVTSCGFLAVSPNDSRVLLLFGEYKGSVRESGFYWVNPFYTKRSLSLRVRNFETGATTTPEMKDAAGQIVHHKSRTAGKPSKVNDKDGNPIEISAVVVWRVVNTAEAMFEVDDYEDFVAVQSEAALRSLAGRHPYDGDDEAVTLRGNVDDICGQLKNDIQERLDRAGVEVIEARISHLAYAAEIASAMLQRQQASAVVAARTKIVDGAVGMVRMALEHLAKDNIVELDASSRVAMVTNLLVVLCGDRHVQPVLNVGSNHK
ncbi:MAG: SPFH domain-containing protein [Planctomycetia bacterium]